MAMTGYPAGSPQAPQSGMPGGGALTFQGNVAPLNATDLTGAGNQPKGDPGYWQQVLNAIGGAGTFFADTKAARYAPGAIGAVTSFGQGDLSGAIGGGFGTVAMGQALKNPAIAGRLASLIPNPAARAIAQGALSLGGAFLGSQLGHGVAAVGNQLFGGTQAAVQDAARMYSNVQREAGTSAGTGREVGLGGASQNELDRQTALLKQLGVNIPNEYLTTNYQILQKYKDADVGRQMALNQQNAQLTGALNRQIMAGQLASQAGTEAGATTRQILASNPYAASVLNTGAVRGI